MVTKSFGNVIYHLIACKFHPFYSGMSFHASHTVLFSASHWTNYLTNQQYKPVMLELSFRCFAVRFYNNVCSVFFQWVDWTKDTFLFWILEMCTLFTCGFHQAFKNPNLKFASKLLNLLVNFGVEIFVVIVTV